MRLVTFDMGYIQATQFLSEVDINEMGLMVKKLFEKEMSRRDNVCELRFKTISDHHSE